MFRFTSLYSKRGTARLIRSLRPNLHRLEDRTAPATFTVTNIADSGSGSLRNAIASANSTSGQDFITFSTKVFATSQTITLTSGELNITDSVQIEGPGSNLLTVSGNNASRVFDVVGGQAIFGGLRIANGKVAGSGAGIRNQGEFVSMVDCVISNNTATGASGGGLSSIGGSMMVYRSTVSGNVAGLNGGGLDANSGASVYLLESTFAGNTAAAQGAGIGVGSSSLVVNRCTVSGNTATGSGGGVYFAGNVTGNNGLKFLNSTFSGNTANVNGGAVFLSNLGGTLVIQNSTITANSAKSTGGGIRQLGGTGAISVESSIISGNTAAVNADVSNTSHPATVKFSALGSTSGFTFSDLGGNLPVGSNLKLTSLISKGGHNLTHELMSGSPAIDAGSDPTTAYVDQRGTGFPRVVNARADIGAYESDNLVVTNANNSGPGSLRQAVADANAIAGLDQVTFDPQFFATPRTIALTSGEIAISESLNIFGPGAAKATVSGSNLSRVFHVGGAGTVSSMISGLTLAKSKATGPGGAILSDAENVSLVDCYITGNSATGSGGGVSSPGGGTLTLTRCNVTGNHANANGGGVDGNGGVVVTITDSTIAGNSASGQGGGIGVGSSSVKVDRSTVSGNSASGSGGGMYFAGAVGPNGLIVRNSTFSGNTAMVDGGGIDLANFSGTLLVQSSTFTANAAAGKGGGVMVNPFGTAAVTLQASILQGNSAKNGPDVFTPGSASIQACALGSINGITTLNNLGANIIGQDIKLGSLANNGGLTKTYALLPGSPCIDAGYNPSGAFFDQRGLPRNMGLTSDIGAFEVQPTPATITSLQVNDGAAQRSMVKSVIVTFSESVTFPDGMAAAFQLQRTGPGGPTGAVNLAFNLTGNSVTVTFVPGGDVNPEASGSLPDGQYQLSILGNKVATAAGYLDGDGNGTFGGDRVQNLHRLFGDADGDRDVDVSDFSAFRSAFGGASAAFDFNGSGSVDASDFGQFRLRFGASV